MKRYGLQQYISHCIIGQTPNHTADVTELATSPRVVWNNDYQPAGRLSSLTHQVASTWDRSISNHLI